MNNVETGLRHIRRERQVIKERLANMGEIDAIIVLSGSAVQENDGSFRSTHLQDEDARGLVSWGSLRVKAAAKLARQYPDAKVVTLCHSVKRPGIRTPEIPDSVIIGKELVEQGVEHDRLMMNDVGNHQAFDAFTEVFETLNLIHQHNWKNVLIVAPGFQQGRVREMRNILTRLNEKDKNFMDQVLLNYHSRFPELETDETLDHFETIYKKLIANEETDSNSSNSNIAVVEAEAIVMDNQYSRRMIKSAFRSAGYRLTRRAGAKGRRDLVHKTYGLDGNIVEKK